MKSNALRKLVKGLLDTVAPAHYRQNKQKDIMYPHIVFSFDTVDLGDMSRDDYMLTVDIWNMSAPEETEDMADAITDMLHDANIPLEDILPTFYRINRKYVEDPNKDINHVVLSFQIQNYERRD